MSNEQKQNGIIDGLVAGVVGVLRHVGEDALEKFIEKLRAKHADAVVEDIHPCPPGQIWSQLQQKCVSDIG